MDIKTGSGQWLARTEEFKNEEEFSQYVADALTKFDEKVIGSRRVDPEGMYLAFVNEYLSVEKFARDYGISEDYAREQIKEGKSINLSK